MGVLILVVVDDRIVQQKNLVQAESTKVLILVVVEDGLVLTTIRFYLTLSSIVLILIVVEDGLVLLLSNLPEKEVLES